MIGKSVGTIRFAPSTTGFAHPGTLLSALLCWLEARSTGSRFIIRLENLDPERCRPEFESAMLDDLRWFGLDWDVVQYQQASHEHHESALDKLAASGRIYPCSCSRARLRALNRPAPDGGFAYDNHCRDRKLPAGGWRASSEPLRIRLDDDVVDFTDLSGLRIHQRPAREMGDPVVRRRDGAIAYHLACVVDDHRSDINLLIRGRDLAPSAPVQIMIQKLMGMKHPAYHHHFLFLENHGGKMAKFHGAVSVPELKKHYAAGALCGEIGTFAGLLDKPVPVTPADMLSGYARDRISREDVALRWDGARLLPLLIPRR